MKWIIRIVAGLLGVLVIAFLLLRTPDTDPGEMRAKYGGEPSQFVTLADGQQIHLRDEGLRDAPAIILLHGSSSDLHTWQPWVDALKSEYRVIRYDQIGHGLTGPSQDDNYALEDFTEDVGQVADYLKLDSFTLGGNSMGGWIAAGYTLAHPERVTGLALIDASGAPITRTDKGGGNIGFKIAATPVINNLMKHITPRNLVEKSYRQSVSNQAIVTPESIDRYWELLRYPGNRAATISRFNAPRVTYDAEQISSLTTPTLVMWGAEDALVPLDAGRWYDQHLPNSRLVVFEKIGHLPMEEAADASVQALKAWLSETGLARPAASGTER